MPEFFAQFEMTEQWLTFNQPLNFPDGRYLRAFFGNLYRQAPLFHQHLGDKLQYRHPLIQYKLIGGSGLIVGLKEGAYLLKSLPRLSELELKSEKYFVIGQNINSTLINFGWTKEFISYRFLTPWFALNEDNYKEYLVIRKHKDKINPFLAKKFISNLISVCKSLGYTVPEDIIVKPQFFEVDPIMVKPGVSLLAFKGSFEVNFYIPDLWGIGKFSSRGYGTIKRESAI